MLEKLTLSKVQPKYLNLDVKYLDWQPSMPDSIDPERNLTPSPIFVFINQLRYNAAGAAYEF